MTAIIDQKDFDFRACYTKARTDYPDELAGATFVDCTDFCAQIILQAHFADVIQKRHTSSDPLKTADTFAEMVLNKDALAHAPSKLLAMHTKKDRLDFLPDGKKKEEFLFIFHHELAHLLFAELNHATVVSLIAEDTKDLRDIAAAAFLKGRDAASFKDLNINISEAQADCFAAMTGLREGWLTKNDVLHIAKMRRTGSPSDEQAGHVTHFALVALAEDYHDGKYEGFSPQHIKDAAYIHGKMFAADTSDIEEYRQKACAYKATARKPVMS